MAYQYSPGGSLWSSRVWPECHWRGCHFSQHISAHVQSQLVAFITSEQHRSRLAKCGTSCAKISSGTCRVISPFRRVPPAAPAMQHLLRYKTRQFATLAASVAAVSAASVVFTETRSFTTVPLLGGSLGIIDWQQKERGITNYAGFLSFTQKNRDTVQTSIELVHFGSTQTTFLEWRIPNLGPHTHVIGVILIQRCFWHLSTMFWSLQVSFDSLDCIALAMQHFQGTLWFPHYKTHQRSL